MNYTADFEEFWKRYPKRFISGIGWVKRKKFPAYEKWQKLPKEIRAKCLARVHLIKQMEGTPRDAVTWINQRGWDDFEMDELKKMPIGLPKEMIIDLLKTVPEVKINKNNERNRQMELLKNE